MSICILDGEGNELNIVGTNGPSINVIQYCKDNQILMDF